MTEPTMPRPRSAAAAAGASPTSDPVLPGQAAAPQPVVPEFEIPEGLEMGEPRPENAPLVTAIEAARGDLAGELTALDRTAREALDPRNLARRNTGKLIGGTAAVGFLALGGPGRIGRRVGRALRGDRPPPEVKQLLPDELAKLLEGMGPSGDAVRNTLDRGFADYVQGRKKSEPSGPRSLWRFVDAVSLPIGIAIARRVSDRIVNPPAEEQGKD